MVLKAPTEDLNHYIRQKFYPFKNEQMKELTQQIEIYIQLLYQVLLYNKAKSPRDQGLDMEYGLIKKGLEKKSLAAAATQDQTKYRAYCLLYEF